MEKVNFSEGTNTGHLDIPELAVRLGDFPCVEMMQSADLRNFDHLTKRGRLDGSADRCIFFKRQMRPATFVVLEIIFQDATQPGFIQDDHVIQAFPANRADQSLNVGVLPWTAGCSEDFVNAHPLGGLLKHVPIAAIAVTEQIARCTIPGESVEKLSCGPFFSWMGSDSKMNRTSAVMVKNDEDEYRS
jgi:hypothetical protein